MFLEFDSKVLDEGQVSINSHASNKLILEPNPLQNDLVLTGLKPLVKVSPKGSPKDSITKSQVQDFLRENPLSSKEDLVFLYFEIPKEIVEKVIEGFQCLVEVYHLYGLERALDIPNRCDTKCTDEQYFNKYGSGLIANRTYKLRIEGAIHKMLKYLTLSKDPSLWVSYFKYKTCAFFAYYEGQEIPTPPSGLIDDDPKVIFFPAWVSYFKRNSQKQDNRKRFLSFLMTINQAKMGMPRDLESSIKKAELKCALHLTTEPPPLVGKYFEIRHSVLKTKEFINVEGNTERLDQDDIDFHELTRVEITKETVCQQLRRTVREMFHEVRYTRSEHYEPFYPSTSSNYNRTRSKMGAVGEMIEFIEDDDELSQLLLTELLEINTTLVVFREELSKRYGDRGQAEQVMLDGSVHDAEGLGICFSDEKFKKVWRSFLDKVFERAYVEEPYVEPLGLLEALKIRVISKGPPFLYTILKPLQKCLWSALKKNSVFQLIGTPITPDLINKIIGRILPSEILVNGDYKASTDNLHSWVSECLAHEVCDVLNENSGNYAEDGEAFFIDERHREMLIRSLTKHKFSVDNVWKDQKEGQLMGSITSFPFLCLANAAFCRWALELADKKEYRLVDRYNTYIPKAPLLINGDDCTLKGNRQHLRKCWEEITSFGGLTSSVGKTFYSVPEHPICMINSVAFDYDLDSHIWEERKYVNMGILLGKKRSIGKGQGKLDQVSYDELGTLHRELNRQCPKEIWPSVSSRFIYYNANTLKKCPNIPWSMPEYLGGPGLVPKDPYSEEDLRCATILKMNMKGDHQYHNSKLRVGKTSSIAEWKLHEVVAERLRPFAEIVGGEAPFRLIRNLNGFEEGICDLEEVDVYSDTIEHLNDYVPYESLEDNYSKLYKYCVIESLFTNNAAVYRPLVEQGATMYKEDSKNLRRNCQSWSRAMQMIYDLDGVTVMKQHEVAYEKKGFVLPVASTSYWKELKESLIEVWSSLEL